MNIQNHWQAVFENIQRKNTFFSQNFITIRKHIELSINMPKNHQSFFLPQKLQLIQYTFSEYRNYYYPVTALKELTV